MTSPVEDVTACTAGFRHLTRHTLGPHGHHHIHARRADVSVHEWFDARGLRTPAWTFDGELPGRLIEVEEGHQAVVYYENCLADAPDKPFQMTTLPSDPPPPPMPQMGPMPGGMSHTDWLAHGLMPHLVPHLHGTVAPPAYDGNPGVTNPILPGERRRFVYPNRQRSAALWYHDHSFGQTAGTVYAGLAAPYVIRGHREHHLAAHHGLPAGDREFFLIVQDKDFEGEAADGSPEALTGRFAYAVQPNKEFAGRHLLTNGRLRPRLGVDQQPYRVRVLNATNGRFLKLFLRAADGTGRTVEPITWVGCDGGLLPATAPADPTQGVFLPTAGRADLVVDFAKLVPGPWQLVNRIENPLSPYHTGSGDDLPNTPVEVIMQFDVSPAAGAYRPFIPPAALSSDAQSRQAVLDDIRAGRIVPREVLMELTEIGDPPMQFINDRGFDEPLVPARERFRAGEWVRLTIRNATPDSHPIHLHLVSFWVEGRTAGGFTPTQETGLLDTVWCPPAEDEGGTPVDTVLLVQFPDRPGLTGRYMFHCHILEHEDHDMMRPFEVADAATAACSSSGHSDPHVPSPAFRRKAGGP